ncbi:MAG: sugar ABC transporter permease [candidate division Zixibacteria bacterium]|nr:sugar ABC transporter permease [candidate division Zixibacteria bacterium]
MKRFNLLILVFPWIATLAIFWVFPVIYSLVLSFTDYSIFGQTRYIGVANYLKLFSDRTFLLSLKNTLYFVFGTIPFTTVIALVLAVLIAEKIPGHKIFQAGYFIPSIVSMSVVAIVFTALYARGGYLHMLGKLCGLAVPENGYLFSTSTALPAIMAMDIWVAVGYYVLLYLAAIKSIPVEIYEAARLDGAGFWRRLWQVTLPQITSMTLFVVVINTIRSFQIFIEIYVMTRGGPLGSTSTVVYFVFDEGLRKFNMGYASAAAYLLFVVILIFSLIQMKLIGGKDQSR